MTFCMNVSRFMNLAAIFSLDLESQSRGGSYVALFKSNLLFFALLFGNTYRDEFYTQKV